MGCVHSEEEWMGGRVWGGGVMDGCGVDGGVMVVQAAVTATATTMRGHHVQRRGRFVVRSSVVGYPSTGLSSPSPMSLPLPIPHPRPFGSPHLPPSGLRSLTFQRFESGVGKGSGESRFLRGCLGLRHRQGLL